MSELPQLHDATASDLSLEATSGEDHKAVTLSPETIGSQAVKPFIPPVVDWGPRQADAARKHESPTPDELTFSA